MNPEFTEMLRVECPVCRFRRPLTVDEKVKYRLDSKSYDFIAPWCSVEHREKIMSIFHESTNLKTYKVEITENDKIISLQKENNLLRRTLASIKKTLNNVGDL